MFQTLTEECEIQNIVTNTWNHGCIEKAQSLIASANHVFFVPVALMSTKHNDVVSHFATNLLSPKMMFTVIFKSSFKHFWFCDDYYQSLKKQTFMTTRISLLSA